MYFFFVHGAAGYITMTLVPMFFLAIHSTSELPMYMLLLPKERYGQFCAAQGMVTACLMILGSFCAGRFIDIIGDYRYLFLWQFFFYVISMVFMLLLYVEWKRHGGRKDYVPPAL